MFGAGTDTASTSLVWAIGELLRNPLVMKELQQEALWINAWAIARDPSIWEEPEVFRPERFLNSPMDYIGSHFEFLPFGASRRGCPGIKFAATINELVLANLAYKFEFALEGEHSLDMSDTDGMTAHKKYPILVKATLSPISYLPDSEPIQQESSGDNTTSWHNYSWKTTLTA
ncbi:hypothetical protein E3N88_39256 [Mikania micrantha]|uniref:Cytochrome P450 n=1 Tax=Mikania micrantha TaxID=192012 RepID=A0A5N6LWA0_9ASTR|nr:hypothetical protein E3N88_39256 [Mikania micrantha]